MKVSNLVKLILGSTLLILALPPQNPVLAQTAVLTTQPPGLTPAPAPTDQFGAPVIKNTDFLTTFITTPPITTGSAYAPGNCIGAGLSLTSMSRKLPGANISPGPDFTTMLSVVIVDKSGNMQPLDVVFTSGILTGSVDKGMCTLLAADITGLVGSVSIAATDWTSNTGTVWSIATKQINLPMLTTNNNIRAILISRGTPTFATVSDIIVKFMARQD